jgi:Tol biopolymer transport system component
LQVGEFFTLSADGSRLAYTRDLKYSNLWLAELSGPGRETAPQIRPLTSGTSSFNDPIISPNGKWVAFATGSPYSNIHIMPIEGGTSTQLTFSEAIHRFPAWSPYGNQIAFGSNEGGINKVWIVDAAGGAPRQFHKTQLSSDLCVFWSPWKHIIYQRQGKRDFLILNPVSEEEHPLDQDESISSLYDLGSKTRPAGMSAAASLCRIPYGMWTVNQVENSITLTRANVTVRFSFSLSPIGCSPDGSTIYLTYDREYPRNTILTSPLSPSGGSLKTLLTMPGNITGASMSSDGKKFVCNLGEIKSDVWIVENFDPAQRK